MNLLFLSIISALRLEESNEMRVNWTKIQKM